MSDDESMGMPDPATVIAVGQTMGQVAAQFSSYGHDVKFIMNVDNYTDKWMMADNFSAYSGHVSSPPSNIEPETAESCAGHKAGGSTGCVGTMTWGIQNTGYSAVVMYSVPYDQNLYSNWLSVGIFDNGE